MHNAHAIGQFALVVGIIIGTLLNVFFVWIALLISGLRTGFGGKLIISAAGIIPLQVFPNLWGFIASLLLIMYFVRTVTDAEDWTGPLKYLGAQVVIGIAAIAIFMKIFFGSFDFAKIAEAHKNPNALQEEVSRGSPPVARQRSNEESEHTEGGSNSGNKNYGLSPEELAEVERQMNAPVNEFRKR